MKSIRFYILPIVLVVGAILMLARFRVESRRLRSELALAESKRVESTTNSVRSEMERSPRRGVSPELLRQRDEIQALRRELAEVGSLPVTKHKQRAQEDWDWVHAGMRPSDWPGFVRFEKLEPQGNGSVDAAFQTFQHAMRNQQREPLTPTRMKEFWEVPDDFDQPPGYDIDLGAGMGSEVGYRIVSRGAIAINEVQIEVEYETQDGGSFRRQTILVQRDGKFRVKPARVSRAQSQP